LSPSPGFRRTFLLGAVMLGAAGCTMAAEEPLNYIIFFAANSAELDSPAQGVIAEAAAAAKAAPGRAVTVEGYANRGGTAQANEILSRLRAQVVADGLAERGVDKARVRIRPKVATGGDPGIESRRVEVIIGR